MQNNNKSILGKIVYTIVVIGLIFIACKLFQRYTINNFNDFIRTEYKPYTSEFTRDSEIKYSDTKSYKISSPTRK